MSDRIQELDARVKRLESSLKAALHSIYLLTLKSADDLEDIPGFVELRELIFAKDGGEEMVEFHKADLHDLVTRHVKGESTSEEQ